MDRNPLIGVSICAVVLLVLGSLSNVVGYQTVQSSNQKIINEEVNQKELLFQTIIDMMNNKEIQGIIFKSQISREGFFNPFARFSKINFPIVTKNHLKLMYHFGLLLSKVMSTSKIYSFLKQYKLNNQGVQKEISIAIEKNMKLKNEMMQLSNSKCDCENDKGMNWSFPVLCTILFFILYPVVLFGGIIDLFGAFLWFKYINIQNNFEMIMAFIGIIIAGIGITIMLIPIVIALNLNCWWSW